MTYLITFACYGSHLHGSESGSVDREHNAPGTPILEVDFLRATAERERMDQAPYQLDRIRRDAVLEAIHEVCAHRGWSLLAAHVRSSHVHTARGSGGATGAGHERLQGFRKPPFESDEPRRTGAEAMGTPWEHTMVVEATARFGGHSICSRRAG